MGFHYALTIPCSDSTSSDRVRPNWRQLHRASHGVPLLKRVDLVHQHAHTPHRGPHCVHRARYSVQTHATGGSAAASPRTASPKGPTVARGLGQGAQGRQGGSSVGRREVGGGGSKMGTWGLT